MCVEGAQPVGLWHRRPPQALNDDCCLFPVLPGALIVFHTAHMSGGQSQKDEEKGDKGEKEAWSMSKAKIFMMECNRGSNGSKNHLHLHYDFTDALSTREAEPSLQ